MSRALLLLLVALPFARAASQVPAIPGSALAQPTAPVGISEVALDSACAARALPLAGAALFTGLRSALANARAGRVAAPASPVAATMRATSIAAGWYAVLLFIGLSLLAVAGDRLRRVAHTLEQNTVGALWTGVLADVAAIPLLVLTIVALALTIVGILLVPFAAVAILIVYAGLAVMGFLAVASVVGRASLGRKKDTLTERAASLLGMILGVTMLMSVWFIAALFTWAPMAGLVLRSMALGVTAVAITAGVGAVIRSARRAPEAAIVPAVRGARDYSWETPTPIGGVVAARRSAR